MAPEKSGVSIRARSSSLLRARIFLSDRGLDSAVFKVDSQCLHEHDLHQAIRLHHGEHHLGRAGYASAYLDRDACDV